VSTATLVEIRNLRVERGDGFSLAVPRLEIARGETLALLGPNGSGKSTLLLALAGIVRPAAGRLRLGGEGGPAPGTVAWRREAALVFQEALLLRTTVRGNVESGLRFRGVPGPERRRRVAEALERLRVGHLAERPAATLSGGEAQRVSLARALACRPRLLLLDEPFAALDLPTREELLRDFGRVLAETATTAVVATHDRVEALRLAARAAVVVAGRIAQVGPPGEVVQRPATAAIARFLGVENLLPARPAAGGRGAVVAGERILAVADPPGGSGALLACVRPEHVALLPADLADDAAGNAIPARVTAVTPLGPLWRVELDAGWPLVAFASPGLLQGLSLAPGARVTAVLPPEAIHLVPAGDEPCPAGP